MVKTKTTTFRLATFQKRLGPLSKTIKLNEAGQPVSDADDCKMSSGDAWNKPIKGVAGLAELINEMTSECALALGTIDGIEQNESVRVTMQSRLRGFDGVIARDKDHLHFDAGQPGFLLVDFDKKGMPDEVRRRVENAGGVWPLICTVLPDLVGAGYLRRTSTSAGLFIVETGEEFPGSGGEHIYVAVLDAADISRATKVLHQRLWLTGLGWIRLGKVGQMLERSIVDQSVGSPERLVFEGPPILEKPLEQSADARRPVAFEGDVIDTRVAIADLTPVEAARYAALVAIGKAKLKPEADARREMEDERLATKLAEDTGVEIERARRQIRRRHEGHLLPLHPLHFDDASLGEVTVGDVLRDPERFEEQSLADPLEGVAYGRNKAKVYRRHDGQLWINSFAHGGEKYDLVYDAQTLRAIVKDLENGSDTEAFMFALASADLKPGELKDLLDEAKRRSGVSVGDLRTRLNEAKRSIAERPRGDGEDHLSEDGRVLFDAPAGDGELTPTMTQIDEVLIQVASPIPPFRTLDHRLAVVSSRAHSRLHELGHAVRANKPAPNQALIKAISDAETQMLIEEHICFRSRRYGHAVRLQPSFARAYAAWEGSNLPRVSSIATLPFVLSNMALKSGDGLVREIGLIFDIEPELRTALGDGKLSTLAEAKEAYDWLRDHWLVDVETDNAGQAILVALALTMIERHLLAEFPAFFVTAAQRGSGKTTVLNMVSTALTGSMASAASWSFDEEEQRKSIFSFLREGVPFVVFDNIPRGSAMTSPTLERVLTMPELSDRILGLSEFETVATSTVIAFTGNNVRPKGDMASRSLVADLVSNRPDPENRDFEHEDAIEWTQTNRIEILSRLFTILMLDRDAPNRSKTRFKPWWNLVGHPLELVSGVDFEELFSRNDKFDEEGQGATEFISMMLRYVGAEKAFSASEINLLLDTKTEAYVTYDTEGNPLGEGRFDRRTLMSALEEASGRAFTGGLVNAHRVAKKLKSIEGRPVKVDGCLFTLSVDRDHEGHRYKIVPL